MDIAKKHGLLTLTSTLCDCVLILLCLSEYVHIRLRFECMRWYLCAGVYDVLTLVNGCSEKKILKI